VAHDEANELVSVRVPLVRTLGVGDREGERLGVAHVVGEATREGAPCALVQPPGNRIPGSPFLDEARRFGRGGTPGGSHA
jgi:hypothetical protein